MLIVENEIKKGIYKRFMQYVTQKCNRLSFSVPDFTRFPPGQPEYINKYILKELDKVCDTYHEDISEILNVLSMELVEKAEGWGSFITGGGVYFEQYTVELNENVLSVLLSKNSLEDWRYPNAPTRLNFFINKKWYVSTNSDIGMCYINTSDEDEIKYLKKKVGLKFF